MSHDAAPQLFTVIYCDSCVVAILRHRHPYHRVRLRPPPSHALRRHSFSRLCLCLRLRPLLYLPRHHLPPEDLPSRPKHSPSAPIPRDPRESPFPASSTDSLRTLCRQSEARPRTRPRMSISFRPSPSSSVFFDRPRKVPASCTRPW